LDARLNLGVVDVEGSEYQKRRKANKLYFSGNEDVSAEHLIQQLQQGAKIEVWVDDERILKGRQRKKRILFKPNEAEFHQLRTGDAHFVDVADLESSGVFNLVLYHPEDGMIRVPIASWEKTAVEIPCAAMSLPTRIQRQRAR